VGTFADYGILSFGDEKICPGIGGGALVCRDKDVFLERSKAQLTSPARIETLGKCFSTLMWKSWGHWSAPPWRICLSHADPAALPSPYRRESMANLCAAVAVTLMENLDQQISARRECVRAYQKLLGKESRLKLIRHRSGSACLTQVVRILPKDRDVAVEVVKAVRAEGYEVRGCYVPLHLISELSSCLWDRLPYADRVWSDLVELPCDPAVGVDEVQRIAAIVAGVASN
jgi:dTDP-4-amino-4,6-dideoxygalactose transaminase